MQKADMAAVFLPVMADAREHINFSTTTLDEGNWIMIMNRPGESATGSGLLAPFDRDVWLLILLSLLTVGPSIYGLIIIRMKLTRDKSQQIYPLPHCVWFVYGALMKQGSTLSPLAGKFSGIYIQIRIASFVCPFTFIISGCCFGRSYILNIRKIHRRLAWPLHKDDTQNSS